MAKAKGQVTDFIKSTDTRRKSTDLTNERLSVADIGRDFVPVAQQGIHPVAGTNVTTEKSRND